VKINKLFGLVFAILIFLLGFSLSFLLNNGAKSNQSKGQSQLGESTQAEIKGEKTGSKTQSDFVQTGTVKVTRVIDGDTIEIGSGQKVRYIGIDTPETVHPDKTVQCFGAEASAKNRELVERKQVHLEKDVSETDKYGRLLRYVYVGDTFVNDYLLRQGYAHSSSYPPDIKYQDEFRQAEAEARENNRGLWAACQSGQLAASPPANSANESGASGCSIKGNISSSKEKIYHMPAQRYYDKTQIDESKGEQWFCTEEDAISAGFRKSKV